MSIEIGNVYSRLTVLSKAEDRISPTSGKARFYWVCKCSCDRNKIIEVRSDGLTGGRTKSCGKFWVGHQDSFSYPHCRPNSERAWWQSKLLVLKEYFLNLNYSSCS